ncbi:MAG: enoyl-CoA hydratase-related protein [Blastomonas sp.]
MGGGDYRVDGLAVERTDTGITVAFDRPAQRNAITYDMYEVLTAIFEDAKTNPEMRSITLTGTGSIFTAGHDMSGFARGLSLGVEEKPSFGFMRALSECPAPVIAAVNGDAVGIGATMLFHCDFVYAVPGARLVFPFMKMGLIPEFASTHYLPRMIGQRQAMELFLLQGQASTEQALQWGLISALIPHDDLGAHAASVASVIAALSPQAVRETKRLAKQHEGDAVRKAISDEAHSFHELLKTDFVKDRIGAIQQNISGKGKTG